MIFTLFQEQRIFDKHMPRRTSSTKPKEKEKVLFAADVRFQPSKPRRSYKGRGDRIIKVSVEQRFQNDNRMNELGFSMHKGLKADDERRGAGRQARRSTCICSSTRIQQGQGNHFYDGKDELHEYDVGPEESKKVKKFSIVTCMVQPTWIRSKIKFLMDTGCGLMT